jgi:hypothetical protein
LKYPDTDTNGASAGEMPCSSNQFAADADCATVITAIPRVQQTAARSFLMGSSFNLRRYVSLGIDYKLNQPEP